MNTTIKSAQFTQGPWVVDEDYEDEEQQAIGIVKEGHGYIAGIHILASSNNGEGFTSEDRANATLIAAAPVMYADLCAVRDYLFELYDEGNAKAGEYAASLGITIEQAEGQHHE